MGGRRVKRKSRQGKIGIFGPKGQPPGGVERRRGERRQDNPDVEVRSDRVIIPAEMARKLKRPVPGDISFGTRASPKDNRVSERIAEFEDRRNPLDMRVNDERTGPKDRRASKRPGASGRRKSDKK